MVDYRDENGNNVFGVLLLVSRVNRLDPSLMLETIVSFFDERDMSITLRFMLLEANKGGVTSLTETALGMNGERNESLGNHSPCFLSRGAVQ